MSAVNLNTHRTDPFGPATRNQAGRGRVLSAGCRLRPAAFFVRALTQAPGFQPLTPWLHRHIVVLLT